MIKEEYSKNNIEISLGYGSNDNLACLNVENIDCGLLEMIKEKFELKEDGKIVMDIVGDEGFQNFRRNNFLLEYSWSTWYPFELNAKDIYSNKLIEEIFEWLQSIEIPVECD
jgi:hypothetical protein